MWSRVHIYLSVTAVVALSLCFRTSTAAIGSLPPKLAIPFNDLLPPLLDAEADAKSPTSKAPEKAIVKTTKAPLSKSKTTNKTPLTTHVPPVLFKTTKKSYYQQQTDHIKELHLIDADVIVPHDYSEQAEHLQHLQDARGMTNVKGKPQLPQQKFQKLQQQPVLKSEKHGKTQKPIDRIKADHINVKHTVASAPTIKPSKPLEQLNVVRGASERFAIQTKKPSSSAIKTPTETHTTTNAQQIIIKSAHQQQKHVHQDATKLPEHQHKHQQLQLRQQQHRFQAPAQPLSFENFQQYFDFQHTTLRPPKAGLPTLTPFPRHLK